MTLVVAETIGSCFHIQCDSLITNRDVVRPNDIPGRLKSIVLSRDLCVSFAGRADAALDAIRQLYPSTGSRLDASLLVDELYETHKASGGEIDFLVCSLGLGGRFVKIAGDSVAEGADRYWIGDPAAVSEFQRQFDLSVPPQNASPDHKATSRSLDAFSSLLRETRLPTVGGFRFHVASVSGAFQYMDEAASYYPTQDIPSGVATALRFGGPAEGGFAYSVLTPDQAGVPIVGVHLYQGRLGLLYDPLNHDDAIQIPNVSHKEFREKVLALCGVSIDGLTLG
jgi:hypothetical protein